MTETSEIEDSFQVCRGWCGQRRHKAQFPLLAGARSTTCIVCAPVLPKVMPARAFALPKYHEDAKTIERRIKDAETKRVRREEKRAHKMVRRAVWKGKGEV